MVTLLAAPHDLNDLRLHNLIPIVVVGAKFADVDMITPDRDGLSNARVGGRLFFDNLE